MKHPIVNLKEVKNKLIEKLRPSGWASELRGFLNSQDFDKVLESLYNDRCANKRFTPGLNQVFRAFEECPVDKLQVVIIGQNSYSEFRVADGIAFSCGNKITLEANTLPRKIQPELQKIFEAIEDTVKPSISISIMNPDLTRWANQGILMLNTALTCRIGFPNTHVDIWYDFMAYILEIISIKHPNLVYVFMGDKAQYYEQFIVNHNLIITTEYPNAINNIRIPWICNDMFNRINNEIKTPILWN